jgi:hypothetical protein
MSWPTSGTEDIDGLLDVQDAVVHASLQTRSRFEWLATRALRTNRPVQTHSFPRNTLPAALPSSAGAYPAMTERGGDVIH